MDVHNVKLFDRSFDNGSGESYSVQTKSGLCVNYRRRSELWKDKTASLFVTFYECEIFTREAGGRIIKNVAQLDVRYNDVAAIWCETGASYKWSD